MHEGLYGSRSCHGAGEARPSRGAASREQGLCLATPAGPPWSHRPPVPCPRPTLAVFSYPLIHACCLSPVALLYTGPPAPLPQAIGEGWLGDTWLLSPAWLLQQE